LKRTWNKSRIVAIALFVVTVPRGVYAQPQAAGDIERAREIFVQAIDQRDGGDAVGALAKFKAAHALASNPVTAFELGQTYAMLGMLIEAREVLSSMAGLPMAPEESARSTEARQAAPALQDAIGRRIPKLVLKVSGHREGLLSVTVDGTNVPADALAKSLPLNPGIREVVAADSAGDRAEERIELKEGEVRELTLVLAQPARPAAPVVSATLARQEASQQATNQAAEPMAADTGGGGPGAVIGLSVGAAGCLAGAILGALALSKISGIDGTCSDVTCAQTAIDDLRSARTLGYESMASFAVGGVGLVVGVVALLSGSSSRPHATRAIKRDGAAGSFVVPWVGPGAVGLRGAF
jgi:hypothetical protein